MIERQRGGYLKTGHHANSYTMTIIAIQVFVLVVLRVTEANAKSWGHLARANVAPQLMTDTARRNVPVARLGLRSMALKTCDMRVESRGDGH